MDKYKNIIELLKIYNQEHIIMWLEKLEEEKKEELVDQISRIDIAQIIELYENNKKQIEIKQNSIEEINYLDKSKLKKEQLKELEKIGDKIIKNSEYAVVTMAGGQGTRLGHTGPKGTFKLDIYGKGKYIFEILADNIKKESKKHNVYIPWYIMTSKENNEETVNFLEKNNYFGYNKKYVKIFIQKEMPLIDTEGKLLINRDFKIKEASDGNGGVYASLRLSGCLLDMKEKGIKWIFIGGVDNVLVKLVDRIFIGMACKEGKQIASKSVVKLSPSEKVGVFCKINNRPKIIEYSELPKKMAEEKNDIGELKFGESNIACHLFTIEALEKISQETLSYHSAFKKNSYIDESGKEVIPEEPNCYKFESFIFDAFELFEDMSILRVNREEEFAPVKNKDGVDSPKTAKELYEKYWNSQK